MFRWYCVYLAALGVLLPLEAGAVKEAVKDVRFRTHGDKVHIYYTLEGRGEYEVSVRLSDDGGRTFPTVLRVEDVFELGLPKSLSGAIGKGVKPGRDKEVIWDVLRDYPRLEGSDFVFRVTVRRFGGPEGAASGALAGAMLGGVVELPIALGWNTQLRRTFRGRYGIVTGILTAVTAIAGAGVREMEGQSPPGSIHPSRRPLPPARPSPTEETPPGLPARLVVEELRRAGKLQSAAGTGALEEVEKDLRFRTEWYRAHAADYTTMNLPDGAVARLGKGTVHEVRFSPDGRLLAVASSIGIWLYDARTHDEIALLTDHRGTAIAVSFSPDGTTLASGSLDGTVKLWSAAEGRAVGALEGHRGSVESVVFSPDGRTLASASSDSTIKLWSVVDQREIDSLAGQLGRVTSVSFSPDGRTLVSASSDSAVRLWSVAEGRALVTLGGHGGSVESVVFSPDGRTLASASSDSTVRLWSVAERREVATLEGPDRVESVVYSPDGRTLASGSWGGSVRLWSVAEGREIASLMSHGHVVTSVVFSPDGGTLAWTSWGVGVSTVELWSVADPREIASLTGHRARMASVSFSPDGTVLASSGGMFGTPELWSVADRREIASLEGGRAGMSSVSFSPDGTVLASSGRWVDADGAVRLWSVADRREIAVLEGHGNLVHSVVFSPDGRMLASGSSDSNIKLWSAADRREVAMLTGHFGGVGFVSFSPDGRILASASSDSTVRLWSVAEGRELATLEGHDGRVRSVVFSPDGRTLASASSDSTVRLWSVAERRELATLQGHDDVVESVSFSPAGRTLASGSWDGTIKLWSVGHRREITTLTSHGGRVSSVVFSPDGTTLASAGGGRILLWEGLLTGRHHPPHGVPTLPSHLVLQEKAFLEPSGNRALDAEEEGSLYLKIGNDGLGPAKVSIRLTPLGAVEHVEFERHQDIGTLPPGESRIIEIPLRAGLDVRDGQREVRVEVVDEFGQETVPVALRFATRSLDPPEFRIVVRDYEDGTFFSRNRPDGQVEAGEMVKVIANVQNVGGDADGVVARIETGQGRVSFSRDLVGGQDNRFVLGEMAAGVNHDVEFYFFTSPVFDQATVDLTLEVVEARQRFGAKEVLSFDIGQSVKTEAVLAVEAVQEKQRDVVSVVMAAGVDIEEIPKGSRTHREHGLAVIMGIEEYRYTFPAMYKLRDATLFYQYSRDVLGIPEGRIFMNGTSEQATKAEFDYVFEPKETANDGWLKKRLRDPEEAAAADLFVYLAGHGFPDLATGRPYLIPYDVRPEQATNGVSLEDLYRTLSAFGARSVTVFVESCFSGASGYSAGQPKLLAMNMNPVAPVMERPMIGERMVVFAATSGDKPSSNRDDLKHGIFTYFVLKGLGGQADGNGDRAVSVEELYRYLAKEVPAKAVEPPLDREQVPEVWPSVDRLGDRGQRILVQY